MGKLTTNELWERIKPLVGKKINSLTGRSSNTIVSVNELAKKYTIQYESGNRIDVELDALYALYTELYLIGSLTNEYMNRNCKRVLGWSSWNRPGSAMFAILPHLDKTIRIERGELHITRE